uniref:Uncharacterized protein n=1 Tax=uncultured euryarchaeote Alv-FOS1 TaxID=337892 RepID=Q3SAC4_9EURY|nr:hypothetical protein [uncultured euryarchaeote Alv-FOS1]
MLEQICKIGNTVKLPGLKEQCQLIYEAIAGLILINAGFAAIIVYILTGARHSLLTLTVEFGIYATVLGLFIHINHRYDAFPSWRLRVQELGFIKVLPLTAIMLVATGTSVIWAGLTSSVTLNRYYYSGLGIIIIIIAALLVYLTSRYGISIMNTYPDAPERFIKCKTRLSTEKSGSRTRFKYGDALITLSGAGHEIRIYRAERLKPEELQKIVNTIDSL